MYLYNVGYHSHEDCGYRQYCHEYMFTEAELLHIVAGVLVEITPEYIEKNYKDCLECDVAFSMPWIYRVLNSRLFVETFKSRGFEEITYTAEVSLWGWKSVIDDQKARCAEAWQLEIHKKIKDAVFAKLKDKDGEVFEWLKQEIG